MGSPGFFACHHTCPCRSEGLIIDAGSGAGTALHAHFKSLGHQLSHRIGCESNPLLINLDFARNADGGHWRRENGVGHGCRELSSIWLSPLRSAASIPNQMLGCSPSVRGLPDGV